MAARPGDTQGRVPVCPACGQPLVEVIDGLCARCLIGQGLDCERPAEPGAAAGTPYFDWLRIQRTHVAGYALLDEIARGGMGIVYRARQQHPSRVVALKMMLPLLAGSESLRQRFRVESDAIAQLDHPGILPIYEVGECDGLPFYSMKFAEGRSLEQRAHEYSHHWRDIALLIQKIARAVDHAHGRGILHRDLKPGNILFDSRDEPLVADFGLAKYRAIDERLTLPSAVLGSPNYMAPEQLAGTAELVGPATDVYSLGAILYELLTGRPPIQGSDALATLRLIPTAVPEPGMRLDPELPVPLDRIARKCLEKEPGRRYPTAAALAEDLERWLQGKRVAATARRRYGIATAAVIGAGIVIAALAIVRMDWRRAAATLPPTANTIAVLPFADLSEHHDQGYFSDGLADEMISLLAQIEGLRVASRTASFALRDRVADIATIGRHLQVASVLEGSVRRSGDKFRVNVRLIETASGRPLWSNTYDRDAKGIFEVQGEIARAVVSALRVKLLPQQAVVSAHRTESTEAYMQYLLGKQYYYYAGTGTTSAFRGAAAAYHQATVLDPTYAAAYAGLAESSAYAAEGEIDKGPAIAKAISAADRAIELAPDLADGYSARALIRELWVWDWNGAKADAERAITLDPSSASAHRRYGMLLGQLGALTEGIAELRKSADLDPLVEGTWGFLGFYLTASGQYAEARQALARGTRLEPGNMVQDRYYMGINELKDQHPEAALIEFARSREPALRWAGIALAQHSLGHAADSQSALRELLRNFGEREPYLVAADYAWLGDRDNAFLWLQRAYVQHQIHLSRIKVDPIFDDLRGDPRFAALLHNLNL